MSILQNTVGQTRQVKTIPRNSPRHSYDGLGHCESSIKEAQKPTCVFFSQTTNGDSNRQVVWTNTPCIANNAEQTSSSMWMSNDCHGEFTKFAVWSWFRNTVKQFKPAKVETSQWTFARDQRIWLETTLKAVLVMWKVLLDIKLNKKTRCCKLRQWSIMQTQLLMPVTSKSIILESCGTETSASQHISVWFDGGRKVQALMVLRCVWQRSHLKRVDLVSWRLGSTEVNQYEKYDGFTDMQTSKVFLTWKARATSQRHTEHGHRKIIAIMDATTAMFPHQHGRMDSCTSILDCEFWGSSLIWFSSHCGCTSICGSVSEVSHLGTIYFVCVRRPSSTQNASCSGPAGQLSCRHWYTYSVDAVMFSWGLVGTQWRWSQMRTTKPRTSTITTMQTCMGTVTVSWWRCGRTSKVSTIIGFEARILTQISSWE